MDFLDPNKKRAHTIRLFIGYILVAIAIAFGSLVLLFQSYGYDLDRRTGQVIQNGLVFVSAKPDSASIYLNGTLNKSKTDTKLTIPAGQYALELRRPGYRTWKRSFNLEGGSIERLSYGILFPEKLVTTDVQLYASAPSFAAQSLDKRWLYVLQPGSFTTFDLFDLTNADKLPIVTTLPAGVLSAGSNQKFTALEWSEDNKHLLLLHEYDGASEYVVIDRETPAASINVNKTLGLNPTRLSLRDKRYDQWYVHDAATGTLQTYDYKTKTLQPLLQKVLAYDTHDEDKVLYASNEATTGEITIKLLYGENTTVLRSYSPGNDILLNFAQYDSNWYAVVSTKQDNRVYIYRNPQNTTNSASLGAQLVPASILKLEQPTIISFSDNNQFIAAQSGTKFAVYDAEADRRYYYELLSAAVPGEQAVWIDGFHLSLGVNNQTQVFDFDGGNQQTLTANQAGFSPYFDPNMTTLYNLAPSVIVPGRYALTSTLLQTK